MSTPGRPAVALACVGDPVSPATWSGTAAGVFFALRDLGVAAHAIDLSLPSVAETALLVAGAASTRNRYDAESAALTSRLRSRLLQQRMRALDLDGVIQVGTIFATRGVPYVTLEDMTVRQAREVHPVNALMSLRGLAGWESRRGAIYADARRCTVASHWAAESLCEDYGLSAAQIAVVGLGANHLPMPVGEARNWTHPRFLFIGVDWERKGGPLLLRAFARLREQRPDAQLDLVGGHPHRVAQPGVCCHGMLSRERPQDGAIIGELFARATCLVMPSLVEPFGIVHVEAGTAGIPSIATSVGGPRDVIGPDGGLLVVPGDEEGLYGAMLEMSDPERARRMGEQAARRAGLYTWQRVAERLLRALELAAPDGRELAAFL